MHVHVLRESWTAVADVHHAGVRRERNEAIARECARARVSCVSQNADPAVRRACRNFGATFGCCVAGGPISTVSPVAVRPVRLATFPRIAAYRLTVASGRRHCHTRGFRDARLRMGCMRRDDRHDQWEEPGDTDDPDRLPPRVPASCQVDIHLMAVAQQARPVEAVQRHQYQTLICRHVQFSLKKVGHLGQRGVSIAVLPHKGRGPIQAVSFLAPQVINKSFIEAFFDDQFVSPRSRHPIVRHRVPPSQSAIVSPRPSSC